MKNRITFNSLKQLLKESRDLYVWYMFDMNELSPESVDYIPDPNKDNFIQNSITKFTSPFQAINDAEEALEDPSICPDQEDGWYRAIVTDSNGNVKDKYVVDLHFGNIEYI